jgi:hypothetical protein
MVDQVPINSPYETFSAVAKELFCDGIYNWGRIVILFYFTYKLILKVRMKEKNIFVYNARFSISIGTSRSTIIDFTCSY